MKIELLYKPEDCCETDIDKNDLISKIQDILETNEKVDIYNYNEFLDRKLILFKVNNIVKEKNYSFIKINEALKILLPLLLVDNQPITEGNIYKEITSLLGN